MKKANKVLAMALAILVVLGALAGCTTPAGSGSAAAPGSTGGSAPAPASAPAESANEKIRVVTFFAGSDQWAPVWKEVIGEYMDANPGIEIVDESQPTSGTNDVFRTKVQSDIAAKTPPDLMLFFNGADGQMAIDSGLFVDWTSYMADDPEWSANLKASPMEAGNLDGLQYCIPYIGYFEGMLYNKALFDKYGLEEPTTWENILACIDTFKENDVVPFSASIAKPSYMTELFLLSQVGVAGQKNYFDHSWAPAMDAIAELYQKGAFPADTLTLTEDDVRVLFADQKAAMMINGSWTISALKDNPDMRMIAMPTLPGGVGGSNCTVAGYGSGWYMSNDAAGRSGETLKFLKYLTSPEVMTKFIAVGGSPAVNCDVPEGATPLEVSALEMLDAATETAPACDSQVVREAWLTITEDGLQYLVEGQKSAVELLDAAKAINDSATA